MISKKKEERQSKQDRQLEELRKDKNKDRKAAVQQKCSKQEEATQHQGRMRKIKGIRRKS